MLYRWQKECIEAWKENHYHGIVDVITGAGKTVMAAEGMRLLGAEQLSLGNRLHVRIIVPTIALARQWKREAERRCGDIFGTISMFYGAQKDSVDEDVTIYVINSARYTVSRHILRDYENGYPVLLIADECHHYCSEENRNIFSYQTSPSYRREMSYTLGLSATPYHLKYEEILVPSLGKCIYRYHVKEASREGTISRFAILQVGLSFSAEEQKTYGELTETAEILFKKLLREYPEVKKWIGTIVFFPKLKEIASAEDDPECLPQRYLDTLYLRAKVCSQAEARDVCTTELIRRLSTKERIIIFCERIEQADLLIDRLTHMNIRGICRYHTGLTADARKQSLDRFRDRESRILVTVRALDEGLDVPDASVGIVMSTSSQERQRIQRLGRILRPSPEKKLAVLYYLYVHEASEDSNYLAALEDRGNFPGEEAVNLKSARLIQTLRFESDSGAFRNDAYEAAAEKVFLKYMPVLSEEEQRVYRKCVENGIMGADYLLPEEEQILTINNVKSQKEKNYWIVMRQIGKVLRSD